MDHDVIQYLSKLPKQCIYGLINDEDKKVYLGFTTNIVTTLGRLVTEYSNKPYWSNLRLAIIETVEDEKALRVRFNYWSKEYSNNGFGLYRKYRAIGYKTRIDLMADFQGKSALGYLLYVKLISRAYKELVVGVFKTVQEAEDFVASNYKSIDNIIYADNELTRHYKRLNS